MSVPVCPTIYVVRVEDKNSKMVMPLQLTLKKNELQQPISEVVKTVQNRLQGLIEADAKIELHRTEDFKFAYPPELPLSLLLDDGDGEDNFDGIIWARIIKEETGEKDLKGTESSSTTHDFQLLGSDESNGSNPHGDGIFRMYQEIVTLKSMKLFVFVDHDDGKRLSRFEVTFGTNRRNSPRTVGQLLETIRRRLKPSVSYAEQLELYDSIFCTKPCSLRQRLVKLNNVHGGVKFVWVRCRNVKASLASLPNDIEQAIQENNEKGKSESLQVPLTGQEEIISSASTEIIAEAAAAPCDFK